MSCTPENSYYCSAHISRITTFTRAHLASNADGSHYLVIDIDHVTIFINDLDVARQVLDALLNGCFSALQQWEQSAEKKPIPNQDLVLV